MREILFKAKGENKGKWHEGLLDELNESFCYIKNYKLHGVSICDPNTICQYTGLKDRNGNKIFENDIVSFIDLTSTENGYSEVDCVGQVVWDEETISFQVTNRISAESYEVLDECLIIGNVFDNPELLEVEV